MSTRTVPQGSYGRVGPDWWIGSAATGGGAYTSSAGNNAQVSLYNNDDQSRYLWVYAIWVGNDADFVYTIDAQAGTSGSKLGDCAAVLVGQALPPGNIYGSDAPNIPSNNEPQAAARIFGNNVTGSTDVWQPGAPIAVLPPGYSLLVTSYEDLQPATFAIMVASFYYLFLPYQE